MPLAETIRDELVKVFTVPQADVLTSCVVRAHDTLATRSDMHELRVAMTELAEQQQETSARVAELAVQQKVTSARVAELAVQQKETTQELKELASTVRALSIRTDTTAGWALEWLVGKHLPAYVGRRIRRCRIVGVMDIIESLEREPAVAGLTADDLDELRRADVVATGTIDGGSLYLVGEVSFTADNDDILRAARRAAVLRKAGQQAQAFVACDQINLIPAEIAR
ncbi:MAG: hypothetical protein WD072_04345, partial [Pirellulales bacterium]